MIAPRRTTAPIVRPGQRRPFHKPTQADIEERITEVENLLRAGPVLKSTLMAHIKKKFNVEWRTAENYLARARERLLLKLHQIKDEHRADSLAFYEGIMMSAVSTQGDKLRARERIDKLLGLDKPAESVVKMEHSGSIDQTQTSVKVDTLNLPLETRKQILEALRTRTQNGKPSLIDGDDFR